MSIFDRIGQWCFGWVHGNNLVYNTCWEDPRLDREALALRPDHNVLVITSAGCNALDYALDSPNQVHAVDMNPRQNALLELKIAGIRALDFESFFQMFGEGKLENARGIYRQRLRAELSIHARAYWDRRIGFFEGTGWRPSFYFRGTAGIFARLVNVYIDRVARLREPVEAILAAPTILEQKRIYDDHLRDAFWKRTLRAAINRDTTLSLIGVPRAQRRRVERDYVGGIAQFVEDSVEAVFSQLPLVDNYFWRVYLTGRYTRDCCPEYLREENFARLKGGLVERIATHDATIQEFLARFEGRIHRFVLLDHMDWMASSRHPELVREWRAIVAKAAPGARLLWRSGGLVVDYVDPLELDVDGKRVRVGELLRYDRTLAARLHRRDRVHTYGSFSIADMVAL